MAVEFLRKWFTRSQPIIKEVEEAQAELERLAVERPTLSGPFSLLKDLLPLCCPQDRFGPLITLPKEHVAAKLLAGIPVLRGEHVAIDDEAVRRRWGQICSVVAKHQDSSGVQVVQDALHQGRLEPNGLIEAVLGGEPQKLLTVWEPLGLDPSLGVTVLRFTLFSHFVSLNQALAPLREGTTWQQGYCPTCGSWPLLGEYRGLEQTRFLRCGLCTADWEVARLFCPFCGNRSHEELGYLHVEGEESSYKAATCAKCQGYVKILSTLTALPPCPLLVADAATLHMDLIAAEHGFANPPV